MPKIIFLPDENICPKGAVIEAEAGDNICRIALENDIHIEHACEMSSACTTCHIYIREGFDTLTEADELEEDLLDKAWGVEPDSRLSCQVAIKNKDIIVEVPKYTINMVSEKH